MIGQLRGRVIEKNQELIVLDVNGVGYEVSCSTQTLDQLALDQPARVYVQTHVREDALQLFGFATQAEKKIFLMLLKVNGVGPKLAMKILSGSPSLSQFTDLIENADVKALSSIPKVGKKTAEQLVLALKGKMSFEEDGVPMTRTPAATGRSELVSALVNLGYRLPDVEKVVAELPRDLEIEDGLRRGLAALSGHA